MGKPEPSHSHRFRRPFWATVSFLSGFAVLIVLIANYYLLPALSAVNGADVSGRRQLSAVSALLLAVLLVTLAIGLFLTFRIHRFFFPRATGDVTKTQYVDAWAEAGKRASGKDLE